MPLKDLLGEDIWSYINNIFQIINSNLSSQKSTKLSCSSKSSSLRDRSVIRNSSVRNLHSRAMYGDFTPTLPSPSAPMLGHEAQASSVLRSSDRAAPRPSSSSFLPEKHLHSRDATVQHVGSFEYQADVRSSYFSSIMAKRLNDSVQAGLTSTPNLSCCKPTLVGYLLDAA